VTQAVRALWPAHASNDDGAARVPEAGSPPRDRPRERHLRRSRMDARLVEIAPGFFGDRTQHSQDAPLPYQAVCMAVGPRQASRTAAIPVPQALPEAAWALPVRRYPRALSFAGGSPSLGGEGVAVLAQSS